MGTRIRDVLGIASIFICILTGAIALTIWAVPLYQWTLRYFDIPQQVGLSFETIMENYYILLRYLHFPWIKTLSLPNFPVSVSGAFHFYEVKRLFLFNYGLLFFSLIGSFLYLRKLKQIKGFWRLVQPFKLAIFIPFLLLLILAMDFDWMFVMFHQLLFNNDAWLFDAATDPVISVLPQDFFMYCFILAFILIETSFIAGYFYFKKKAIE